MALDDPISSVSELTTDYLVRVVDDPSGVPAEKLIPGSDLQAGLSGTTDTANTFLGSGAGGAMTSGDENTLIGYQAGAGISTLGKATAVGAYALGSSDEEYNVAVGYKALQVAANGGDENVAVGAHALWQSTTARENVAVGFDAGYAFTTGGANVLIGHSAMEANASGVSNVAIGRGAMSYTSSGGSNTAVGRDAGFNVNGDSNVAIGKNALRGSGTTAISQSGATAIGSGALASITSGQDNVAVGFNSGYGPAGNTANYTSTGARNTFVGTETGQAGTTQRSDTVAVGYRALVDAADAVAIGSGANSSHAASVAIGKSVATTAAAQVALGAAHLEITEVSEPAAPAANALRLYAKDNGSGATRLYQRTDAGAAEVLTTATAVEAIIVAASDETTALTTGTGKVKFRMPYAFTVTAVRASLTTASTSGNVTVDVNESNSSILSTVITVEQDEKTSTTATTQPVISDSSLADDAEISIDIDGAGTGATGLKVTLIGRRTV